MADLARVDQAELSRRFGEPTARWLHAAGTGTLEEEVRARAGVSVRVRVRVIMGTGTLEEEVKPVHNSA